ncbi:MAG: hypothetical protein V1909_00430 [Candidatus Micrarchaeota archaeon]
MGSGCDYSNCPSICQAVTLEKANAVKTDAVFPVEWISLMFMGIGLAGYLHKKGKTVGAMVLEAIVQSIVVGVLMVFAYVVLTFLIAVVLQPLLPFFLWISTLVLIAAIVFTNDEKKAELTRDKYTTAATAAVLVGLVVLVYVVYVMNSPGFVFQCHGFIGVADVGYQYCCTCP